MFGISMFKSSSKVAAPKVEQALKSAGTKVRTALDGTVQMERVFKGQLYKTETKVAENGVRKTTTRVYADEGKYIG